MHICSARGPRGGPWVYQATLGQLLLLQISNDGVILRDIPLTLSVIKGCYLHTNLLIRSPQVMFILLDIL